MRQHFAKYGWDTPGIKITWGAVKQCFGFHPEYTAFVSLGGGVSDCDTQKLMNFHSKGTWNW
jgi:hypothetical protein